MAEERQKSNRGPGRPPEYEMPQRIDATPEEIAKAFLRRPPKEWQYQKKGKPPSK